MIFIFHKLGITEEIETIPPGVFEDFCRKFSSCAQLGGFKPTIAFDDGYCSDLIGQEIASNFGITTMHFLITSRIGMPGYLNKAEVNFLANAGAKIGSHTHNHCSLIGEPDLIWRNEILPSLDIIESILGKNACGLSVPYGRYNRTVTDYIKSKSDLKIFTSNPIMIQGSYLGRLGVNYSNVHRGPLRLMDDHHSIRRALLFIVKSLLIKFVGTQKYRLIQSFFLK